MNAFTLFGSLKYDISDFERKQKIVDGTLERSVQTANRTEQQKAAATEKSARQQEASITSAFKAMSAAGQRLLNEQNSNVSQAAKTATQSAAKQQAAVTSAFRAMSSAGQKLLNEQNSNAEKAAKAQIAAAKKQEAAVISSLKAIDAAKRQSAATQNDSGSSLSAAFASFAGNFAANAAVSAISKITSVLKEGGAEILRFSASMESSKIAFATLLGSTDAANSHLQELVQFAKTTPFEIEGLVESSQKLQAMGFSASEVIPILNDVGNAVAAAGGGAQRLERVVLAISQIKAKGRVQGQELLQLAENGIPALQMLSKELGKSKADIMDMVKQGEISADQFINAFQKFSEVNFGGLMQEQSRTFSGAMSNIGDILRITGATAFEPFYTQLRQISVRAADELAGADFGQATQILAQHLGEIAGVAAKSAGYTMAQSLWKSFSETPPPPRTISEVIERAFNNIDFTGLSGKFASGIYEAFAGDNTTADKIKDIQAALVKDIKLEKQRAGQLGDTAKQARETANAMQGLGDATENNAKRAEKLQDAYRESADWVSVFGRTSSEAATLQKLLAIDVDAVTSSLGQQALAAARATDEIARSFEEQRRASDLRFDTSSQSFDQQYNTVFSQIREAANTLKYDMLGISAQIREGSKFEDSITGLSLGLSPEKLQELQNLFKGYTDTAGNFVKGYRQIADDFVKFNAQQKTDNKFKSFFEDLNGQIAQLKSQNFDDLNKQLLSIIQNLNLKFESRGGMEKAIDAMRQYIDVTKTMSANGAPTIQVDKTFNAFLSDLGIAPAKIDAVRKSLLEYSAAFNEAKKAATEAEADKSYKNLLDDLNGKLAQNNNLTEYQITLKNLEKLGIQDVNTERAQNALMIAGEIDAYKAQEEAFKKAQEVMRQEFEETKGFIKEGLGFIIEGDFKGLLTSVKDTIKDKFLEGFSDSLTTALLGFNPKNENSLIGQVKNSNNLLQRIAANTSRGVLANARQNVTINSTGGGAAGDIGGVGSWLGSILGAFGIKTGGGGGLSVGGFSGGTVNLPGSSAGSSGGSGGGTNVPFLGSNPFGAGGGFGSVRGSQGGGNSAANNPGLLDRLSGTFGGSGSFWGSQGFGMNSGTIGGVAQIGQIAGGLIGGRLGGAISGAASGAMLGLQIGGPWGAAIGAGAGLIMSLFSGDPKRKRDKKEKLPALNQMFGDSFAQMQALVEQVKGVNLGNALNFNSSEVTAKVAELRGAIAAGGGIQFESKKYKQQAAGLIAGKLREFDALNVTLSAAMAAANLKKESAMAADVRTNRLIPEFATGAYMSSSFIRRNGELRGGTRGKDSLPALLMPGEIVANAEQQARIRRAAGFDVFAAAGIPNYSAAAAAPVRMASGGAVGASSANFSGGGGSQTLNFNGSIVLEGFTAAPDAKAWLETPDGERKVIGIINEGLRKKTVGKDQR